MVVPAGRGKQQIGKSILLFWFGNVDADDDFYASVSGKTRAEMLVITEA